MKRGLSPTLFFSCCLLLAKCDLNLCYKSLGATLLFNDEPELKWGISYFSCLIERGWSSTSSYIVFLLQKMLLLLVIYYYLMMIPNCTVEYNIFLVLSNVVDHLRRHFLHVVFLLQKVILLLVLHYYLTMIPNCADESHMFLVLSNVVDHLRYFFMLSSSCKMWSYSLCYIIV